MPFIASVSNIQRSLFALMNSHRVKHSLFTDWSHMCIIWAYWTMCNKLNRCIQHHSTLVFPYTFNIQKGWVSKLFKFHTKIPWECVTKLKIDVKVTDQICLQKLYFVLPLKMTIFRGKSTLILKMTLYNSWDLLSVKLEE